MLATGKSGERHSRSPSEQRGASFNHRHLNTRPCINCAGLNVRPRAFHSPES